MSSVNTTNLDVNEMAAVEELAAARNQVAAEIRKVIVGQDKTVEALLISLFARGHSLFVGVPGLAKTLLVSTLAQVLNLSFNRVQFTPDLMPGDITGTDILEEDKTTGKRIFRFVKGPIFTNVLLADEINRTPPKTQAALLQAMQEHRVTAGGTTYTLDEPFLVFATQNPIEQEGTYPLPEAQLDRFLMQIDVPYPTEEEEREIVRSTTGRETPTLAKVLDPESIRRLQDLVRRAPVADPILEYAVRLARTSRPGNGNAFVDKWVSWGAGPRGSQCLVLGAKTRALLHGRLTPDFEDIQALARMTLKHRIVANFRAEAEGVTADAVIAKLLEEVPERT
jgi:MoxR-like ATPase